MEETATPTTYTPALPERKGPADTLVIATIRPAMALDCLSRMAPRPPSRVIVVEDHDMPSGADYAAALPKTDVLTFSRRDLEVLGPASWLISRGDSAIKSFGFLMSHVRSNGAPHAIMVLDDDCAVGPEWLGEHLRNLSSSGLAWRSTVPDYRLRGLPYSAGPRSKALKVGLSMGLWRGFPDVDSVTMLDQIARRGRAESTFEPPVGTRVEGPGYVPLCGMNFAFSSNLLPLLYFPLMGQGQPFARFDDIWSGVIAKRACDHLGISWTVGAPFVVHTRASDPMTNLRREAPGIGAHEYFWRLVDAVKFEPTDLTPARCAQAIGEHIEREAHGFPIEEFRGYFEALGRALRQWVDVVDTLAHSAGRLSLVAAGGER